MNRRIELIINVFMNRAFHAVIISTIVSLLFVNCKNTASTGENNSGYLPDSTKKIEIEAIVNTINDTVNAKVLPIELPFPLYNQNDTIDYWTVEGKPARISVSLNFPDKVIWPTFFVHNDELVLVRFRFWSKSDPPFVRETFTYLNAGDMVYCMERKMELPEDGLPLYLREMPFADCERNEDEIRNDYEPYWETINKYLQENIQN